MKNLTIRTSILLTLLFIVCVGSSRAQNTDEPIKVNTVLLNVPIVVSDKEGRQIAGLKKEDFSVLQAGEKQAIEFFEDAEAPMNVAILIDTSGSTSGVLGSIKKAAKNFLLTFGTEDKGMVVSFDDNVNILSPLTSDQKKLKNAINNAVTIKQNTWERPTTQDTWNRPDNLNITKTRSAMFDAMYQVVAKDLAEVKGRKAVILLTDGIELGNKISIDELRSTLTKSDLLVYPIIYQTDNLAFFFKGNPKTVTLSELLSLPIYTFIKDFAEITGGRVYSADADDFGKAFQIIANELKKQYVVGFYPTNANGGESAEIKININRKDAFVRAKTTIRPKTSKQKGE